MFQNNWKFILLSYFSLVIYWIDIDLVSPALPEIADTFKIKQSLAQSIISLDLLIRCLCIFIIGPISDFIGKKIFIHLGAYLMLIGAIICITTPTLPCLYIGKIMQGIGCSTGILIYSIIASKYSNKKAASIMAFLQFLLLSSIVIAPIIGSYIIFYIGWKYIFLCVLVISIAILMFINEINENIQYEKNTEINFSDIIHSYVNILSNIQIMKFIIIYVISLGGYVCWTVIGPFILKSYLNLNIKEVGYFQASLASCSAIFSLIISIIMRKTGISKIFKYGIKLMYLSTVLAFSIFSTSLNKNLYIILLILSLYSISVDMLICTSLTIFYKSFKKQKGIAAAIETIADSLITALILIFVSILGGYTLEKYSILLIFISVLSFITLNYQKIKNNIKKIN